MSRKENFIILGANTNHQALIVMTQPMVVWFRLSRNSHTLTTVWHRLLPRGRLALSFIKLHTHESASSSSSSISIAPPPLNYYYSTLQHYLLLLLLLNHFLVFTYTPIIIAWPPPLTAPSAAVAVSSSLALRWSLSKWNNVMVVCNKQKQWLIKEIDSITSSTR